MTSIGEKADHVRRAAQTRNHRCHWPGCEEPCPPARWLCDAHWYVLPRPLRTKLWQAYLIGREKDGSPSRRYVEAVRETREWIDKNYPSEGMRP